MTVVIVGMLVEGNNGKRRINRMKKYECTVRDKTVQMFFEFGRLLE